VFFSNFARPLQEQRFAAQVLHQPVMNSVSTQCLKLALSVLHYSGAARAAAPVLGGSGAIFMLHHVEPASSGRFTPNSLLSITPEFLEQVIGFVRRRGFEIVSLDEAHRRMAQPQDVSARPFACFTFDDGYRDNRDYAYPVMKRLGVPFAVYVASDFADGVGFLWWLVLERIVRRQASLTLSWNGAQRTFRASTLRQKDVAFRKLYWLLRQRPEEEARGIVMALAHEAGVDILAPCRELVMDWDELRAFAADPLVTIGAHSVRHMALAGLDERAARSEIRASVARIEKELGKPCRHFCYPYGNAATAGDREFDMTAELGLATAVTTRKGFVSDRQERRLTGLPRVSLNGNFQRLRYVEALMSGLPFAMWNGIERVRRGKPVWAGGEIAPAPQHRVR
jgi:peptidoglycan/xylan/chitin deacetylase (PgdA/CDA1 family)